MLEVFVGLMLGLWFLASIYYIAEQDSKQVRIFFLLCLIGVLLILTIS